MIETKRGEFTTIHNLRRAYVESREGKDLGLDRYSHAHPFVTDKLHMSKLGICPRQQMLTILGTEPKWESESRKDNDNFMYTLAYAAHYLTYAALDWAGILVSFEEPISGLPEPWVGRYDALIELQGNEHLLSVKTTRPNAFKPGYRFSFPKEEHRLQEGGYLGYLEHVPGSVIEYLDRGGSNSPLTYYVQRKQLVAPAAAFMTRLEECYDLLPELPDLRPRELVPHYRKRNNMDVYELDYVADEYSWQCAWCPFLYARQDKKSKLWTIAETSPCKPDMRPAEKVAWRSGKRWQVSDREQLEEFVQAQLPSYTVEDEEAP